MIHFSETQRFRQLWIWAMLIAFSAFFAYNIYQSIVKAGEIETENIASIIIGSTVLILIVITFLIIKLETMVQPDGIYYRFYPVHRKFRKIEWSQIRYAFIRKYNPIIEYGGWGMRYLGIFGKGSALNISGNMGLQLVFTNEKRFLIGTKKPEELEAVLRELNKYSVENV